MISGHDHSRLHKVSPVLYTFRLASIFICGDYRIISPCDGTSTITTCRNRKNFYSGDPNRVPEKHFSLILRTQFSILRTRNGSLKHLKKPARDISVRGKGLIVEYSENR